MFRRLLPKYKSILTQLEVLRKTLFQIQQVQVVRQKKQIFTNKIRKKTPLMNSKTL